MKAKIKGFTLIELLVVIAIIGILASIVLSSLSSARNQAADSKVKEQLANMRVAADLYYSSHTLSYSTAADCATGLFSDESSGMSALIAGTVNPVCNSSTSTWAVAAPLVSDATKFWCVDNSGVLHEWSDPTPPTNATLTTCL